MAAGDGKGPSGPNGPVEPPATPTGNTQDLPPVVDISSARRTGQKGSDPSSQTPLPPREDTPTPAAELPPRTRMSVADAASLKSEINQLDDQLAALDKQMERLSAQIERSSPEEKATLTPEYDAAFDAHEAAWTEYGKKLKQLQAAREDLLVQDIVDQGSPPTLHASSTLLTPESARGSLPIARTSCQYRI